MAVKIVNKNELVVT